MDKKLTPFRIPLFKRVVKLRGHFFPHFKRALVYTRADISNTIGTLSAVQRCHGIQRFLGNTANGSSPTRMNGTDRFVFLVENQQRGAIGNTNRQQKSFLLGHHSIVTVE